MKRTRDNFLRGAVLFTVLCILFVLNPERVSAASPTDEILDYRIDVDINEDATVNLTYSISWLVLESDGVGPLSWVKIGIPNRHCLSYQPISANIDSISISHSGGYYAEVYFDDKYYEGETVSFAFMITTDYLYQMDAESGYTEYSFTPGWFDDIAVDNLTISWGNDKMYSWSPDCQIIDGANVWYTSLEPGEKYNVKVTYSNDAFEFKVPDDTYTEIENDREHSPVENVIITILAIIMLLLMIAVPIAVFLSPFLLIYVIYKKNRGFNGGNTKKITRTRIEYYSACNSCGAGREEGFDTCRYCGSSMIKSKEEVTEEDIPEAEKEIRNHKEDGVYRYTSNPNIYVRVKTVNIPARKPRPSGSSTHRTRSSCAHSSCACACACACAGGGRAGCTTKDFYRTNLKLSYLEGKKKQKKG